MAVLSFVELALQNFIITACLIKSRKKKEIKIFSQGRQVDKKSQHV